jgi:uncharacterized protein with ParB-like and HNH nuclease domain
MKLNFKNIKPLTSKGRYEVNQPLEYLDDVIDRYKKYGLDLDVEFQRAHVWNEDQQIAFVEFILRGGETQPLLFNHPNWMGSFVGDMVLVDGKQRLTALLKFIHNELPVFGGYKKDEIDNLSLSNFDIKVNINNLKTMKEVYKWYIELNSGGTPHTEEEISKVKKLLKNLK